MQKLVEGVPRFSIAERDRRWARVREMMRREGIDAIFIPPNNGNWDQFQANVRYLTGIGGNFALASAVFPLEGEPTVVTSPDIHQDFWLQRQDWVTDIRLIGGGWGYAAMSIERMRELGLENARIGLSGLEGNTRFPEGVLSHGIYTRIRDAFPKAELVNANLLMEKARFVKSDEELAFMAKAGEIVEGALDVMARECRPGVPENVVFARMLANMIEKGGEVPTMILWAAGSPQPPSNQYMPSLRKLAEGDIVTTEAEGRWGGYIVQNTQQLVVGRAPEEYLEMFRLQQEEALACCYENLRPGKTIGDIHNALGKLSHPTYKYTLLMHCRGLGDDSPMAVYAPRDAIMRDWEIEENSTFIVKPIVSTPDNAKRVYWGDTVIATTNGVKRLGKRKPEIIETGRL